MDGNFMSCAPLAMHAKNEGQTDKDRGVQMADWPTGWTDAQM